MQEIIATTAYRQSLRERILEVALAAFVQRGIRAVKMDDIAHELGISKRTLYEIYENKALLLFEGVKRYLRLRDEEMNRKARNSSSVISFILEVYRQETKKFQDIAPAFYSDLGKYPQVVKFLERNRAEHRQLFLAFMHRGVSEGYFRKEINYELVVRNFEAVMPYVTENKLYNVYTFEELFSNMVFVILRGVCTLKGVEELDRNLSPNSLSSNS